jgi:ABC-type sugar transport system permease subunit
LDTFDQSIFGFGDSSTFARGPVDLAPPLCKCARTRSASSSSSELEWVFFSVTPTVVSTSRMALLFTSSSRAKSLIRTLLIRPFFSFFPAP